MAAAGFFVLEMTPLITKKTELRLLARTHTRTMVAVLVGIARSNAAPFGARIAAATALLDRGWGRPTTMLAAENGTPVAFHITEIINDIVDPPFYDDDGNVIAPSPQERAPALSAPEPEFESEPEDEPEAQR